MASSSDPKGKGKAKLTAEEKGKKKVAKVREGLMESELTNVCAYLKCDEPLEAHVLPFIDVIRFLRRSRIFTAISTECPP